MKRRRSRLATVLACVALGFADVLQAVLRDPVVRLRWIALDLGGSTTQLFRYVLLLAAVTLFWSARGLLRGKRVAWLLSVTASVASLVGHHVVKADLVGLSLSGTAIAILVLNAGLFRAEPEPALVRTGVASLAVGSIGTYVYGVTGLYFLDAEFRESTSLGEAMRSAGRLLFLLPVSTIEPQTRHGRWFVESVRVLMVMVLVFGITQLLRPVVAGQRRSLDLARVRSVLERFADTPLSYFHLLPDKHQLFATRGEAFIGYKVIGSVAVSLGGAIGDEEGRRSVTQNFLEMCERNGWLPAFHQVSEETANELAHFGLRSLKIGEDAVLDVQSFSLTGSHFKSLRSKTGRMTREGWTVEEVAHPIDDATIAELRRVSDLWLGDAEHRERTFTVGQFDPAYLRDTTVLVARDPDRVVRAFVNVLPSFRSKDGNFDMMRRDPSARLPVMDFLFVAMIERWRKAGMSGMNLGLAPFANISGDSIADRGLRVLYDRGNRVFRFAGLRDFKAKWQPRWEPRYLVYRADTELLSVAFAVSRAGELPNADSSRLEATVGRLGALTRAAVAIGRRLPFTVGVAALVLANQIATTIDRSAYPVIARNTRYNWNDLVVHWQVHRIFTALFVQGQPGLRAAILSMIVLLAASEFVLRSKRTAIAFFLGDICSSLPFLIGARLLAAEGHESARRFIIERDGGSSSAMFSAMACAALSIPNVRARRAATALLSGFLLVALVVNRQAYDMQLIGAAIVGALCWWVFRRSPAPNPSSPPSLPTPAEEQA